MSSPAFAFTKEPFGRGLPPERLFVSRGFQELLARLHHVMSTGTLGVVTGQVGSGKSTAVRAAMHRMDASRYRFVYLALSGLTPQEFYKQVLYQIHVTPTRGMAENRRRMQQAMLEWSNKGVRPIVIIDEAHELGAPMLAELRFALNYQADSYSPMTILLLGQPRLKEQLQLQILECIRQRVNVCYGLPPLGEDEVGAYILHHLQQAGLEKQVFTNEAIELVTRFAKGIPRRINNICRYALMAAKEADSSLVDVYSVQKGMEDVLL